jgi:hypothetical protein
MRRPCFVDLGQVLQETEKNYKGQLCLEPPDRQAKSERLMANAMSNAIDISLISPHIIISILYIYMCAYIF